VPLWLCDNEACGWHPWMRTWVKVRGLTTCLPPPEASTSEGLALPDVQATGQLSPSCPVASARLVLTEYAGEVNCELRLAGHRPGSVGVREGPGYIEHEKGSSYTS
jgi:hypothetical protein